jgi:hypothetical protein
MDQPKNQQKGRNFINIELSPELEQKAREKAEKEGYKSLQEKIRAWLIDDLKESKNADLDYRIQTTGSLANTLAVYGHYEDAEKLLRKLDEDITKID